MAKRGQILLLATCLGITAVTSWLTFSPVSQGWVQPYLILLPLTWAALGFGLTATLLSLTIILAFAITGTNPYARVMTNPMQLSLLLQLAIVVAVAYGLLLSLIADAQRRAVTALEALSQTMEQRVQTEIAATAKAVFHAKRAQRIRALGQIAGGVAHEFNNILQAVTGSLHVIEGHAQDADMVMRFAHIAMIASDRGSIITSRLLGFAQRSTLHEERIEPSLMLDALRDVLTHTLGGRVVVHLELQSELPLLLVDKNEMQIALINLVTNARDAMPTGGTVTISAVVETVTHIEPTTDLIPGRYVRIAVADTGTGMDRTILARAIDPFFTTKPVGTGTGLGLSMAKGFAEQSGGALAIESALGCGTIVTLWLPVAPDPAATPESPSTSPPIIPVGTRVLLVDDEAMVRETLAAGLELSGLSVLCAKTGDEALAVLDAGTIIDILVTDYAMPGMDGLTLIRQAHTRNKTLPAVILTGYIGMPDLDMPTTTATRGIAVLRKPIRAIDLSVCIGRILAART